MSTKIPYEKIITLNKNFADVPKNMEFLANILKYPNISPYELRKRFKTRFPIGKVVLAEGITEEILLPKFAQICGFDFNESGVVVVAAGGKNQVAKEYLKFTQQLNIPIIILLDADADAVAQRISEKLRPQDKLLLIQSGEFEDLLPLELIKNAINYKYKNIFQVSDKDFSDEFCRVKNLEEIYRINGLGEFKKAEFAHDIHTVLDPKTQGMVSDEIIRIIEEIKIN